MFTCIRTGPDILFAHGILIKEQKLQSIVIIFKRNIVNHKLVYFPRSIEFAFAGGAYSDSQKSSLFSSLGSDSPLSMIPLKLYHCQPKIRSN